MAEQATAKKNYYFMAGLPRSGSTLLSAILNQNPKFYSGPSSPVISLMLGLENALASDELYLAYPKPNQAAELVANVISHYYSDISQPVIIDKNRSWVTRLHYISGYFGVTPKVLCPMRNIDEILTSFITMHRRNPFEVDGKINFIDEMLVKNNIPLTDDNRCEFLTSTNGILGQSYHGIQQALIQGQQRQLHFIEYSDLTTRPEETMIKIYEFLEQPYFQHDFSNLVNSHPENDAEIYGLADMHKVRKQLGATSLDPKEVLSELTLSRSAGSEFWRDLEEFNTSS
jgi:sulfotransferase